MQQRSVARALRQLQLPLVSEGHTPSRSAAGLCMRNGVFAWEGMSLHNQPDVIWNVVHEVMRFAAVQ